MKKYILILLSLINIFGCNAQKKKNSINNNAKNEKMIIPNRNISNIEIPKLEYLEDEYKNNDSINTKNNAGKKERLKKVEKYISNPSKYEIIEYNSEGISKQFFITNSKIDSFNEIYKDESNLIKINNEWTNYKDTFLNVDISYSYSFFDSGELNKVRAYSNNMPIGNWYKYDKNGNEILHLNIENYFKMSLLEVLEKINLPLSYSISRLFDENHSYWLLKFNDFADEGASNPPRIILLSDSTGKIIYDELENHQPNYRNSGIIDYNSIYNYMSEKFEPFDK